MKSITEKPSRIKQKTHLQGTISNKEKNNSYKSQGKERTERTRGGI